ncbi:MAG: hypothetical protein JF615_02310 [Asticcacaulis sp.]|nr:hypothetical protein [Asticcacaulis sp.]
MKVCIVGNSHCTALYGALNRGWKDDAIAFDYYVIPGRTAPHLVHDGETFGPRPFSRLQPDGTPFPSPVRSSIGERLDIDPFDALVISAINFSAPSNENLASGDHVLGSVAAFDWLDGVSDPGVAPVSHAFLLDILKQRQQEHGAIRFCADIAGRFRGRVLLQVAPPPSAKVTEDADWRLRRLYGDRVNDVYADFYGLCEQASAAFIKDLDLDIALVTAPEGTIERGFLKPELGSNSDVWHANMRYGERVLGQMAERLKRPR